MKFRQWLNNEVNTGLQRHFTQYANQQIPDQHPYAIKQALHNRVSGNFKRSVDGGSMSPQAVAATVSPHDSQQQQGHYTSLNDLYSSPRVSQITDRKWEETIVSVSPNDFSHQTLSSFIGHKFGFAGHLTDPKSGHFVNDHETRMRTQQQKSDTMKMDGSNEPIMMILKDGKYTMVEGWHRMFSYLLSHSAPPDERKMIEIGQMPQNFDNWQKIRIKALVANDDEQQPQSQQSQPQKTDRLNQGTTTNWNEPTVTHYQQ